MKIYKDILLMVSTCWAIFAKTYVSYLNYASLNRVLECIWVVINRTTIPILNNMICLIFSYSVLNSLVLCC